MFWNVHESLSLSLSLLAHLYCENIKCVGRKICIGKLFLVPSSKHKTLNYILIENMYCTLLLSILRCFRNNNYSFELLNSILLFSIAPYFYFIVSKNSVVSHLT